MERSKNPPKKFKKKKEQKINSFFVEIANIPEKKNKEKSSSQNGIFYSSKWEKWIAHPSIEGVKITTVEIIKNS